MDYLLSVCVLIEPIGRHRHEQRERRSSAATSEHLTAEPSDGSESLFFPQVFAAKACSARTRRTAGACKRWVLVDELVAVLDHVQRARGNIDGVVADAFEAVDSETEPRHLAHQLLDVLLGAALLDLALDEVPNGGARGLFVHGVDGEAGLDVLVGVGRHRVVRHLEDGGANTNRRQSGRIGFQ